MDIAKYRRSTTSPTRITGSKRRYNQRTRSKAPVKSVTIVRLGGLALVFGAVAFLAVFSFLAARFDYPAILDGPGNTVLPRLLATGTPGRTAWALYAFLPLIWLPAAVNNYLLPLWMIGFGVVLLRHRLPDLQAARA